MPSINVSVAVTPTKPVAEASRQMPVLTKNPPDYDVWSPLTLSEGSHTQTQALRPFGALPNKASAKAGDLVARRIGLRFD